ncbi:hypothetical protein [Streptomyces sp. E5N91]|uniref:hypothetical protein n=1 Tax=Streptomyces sp. E5N91 TaxID=1851996 RepID=UPI000EF5DA92|nr:hypothetical protein [Streptomyces sp. E5N91]
MSTESTLDPAAVARHTRFGALPERIRFEDMVEETPTASKAGQVTESSWDHSTCLALDLGL